MYPRSFFYAENLLLVFPFIAACICFLPYMPKSMEFIFLGGYYRFSFFEVAACWSVLFLAPYFLHRILHKMELAIPFIKWAHIISSLTFAIILTVIYYFTPLMDSGWVTQIFPPPTFQKWQFLTRLASFFWLMLFIVQVLFILYVLTFFIIPAKRVSVKS